MHRDELIRIEKWYGQFIEPYRSHGSQDPGIAFALKMKLDHTERVVHEMDGLTRALALPGQQRNLALAIARLHDIGRFPQVVEYGTIADAGSIDHASLGVRILREDTLLDHLDDEDRNLLLTAIQHHNSLVLPDTLNERELHYCRLIRDADKLDIFKVIIETDRNGTPTDQNTALLGLQNLDTVTSEVLRAIDEKRLVHLKHVHSRNDYRLLVLAWVFDLTFAHTRSEVKRRGYVNALADGLPDTPEVIARIDIIRTALA